MSFGAEWLLCCEKNMLQVVIFIGVKDINNTTYFNKGFRKPSVCLTQFILSFLQICQSVFLPRQQFSVETFDDPVKANPLNRAKSKALDPFTYCRQFSSILSPSGTLWLQNDIQLLSILSQRSWNASRLNTTSNKQDSW